MTLEGDVLGHASPSIATKGAFVQSAATYNMGSQRTCGGAASGFHPAHSVAGLIGTHG